MHVWFQKKVISLYRKSNVLNLARRILFSGEHSKRRSSSVLTVFCEQNLSSLRTSTTGTSRLRTWRSLGTLSIPRTTGIKKHLSSTLARWHGSLVAQKKNLTRCTEAWMPYSNRKKSQLYPHVPRRPRHCQSRLLPHLQDLRHFRHLRHLWSFIKTTKTLSPRPSKRMIFCTTESVKNFGWSPNPAVPGLSDSWQNMPTIDGLASRTSVNHKL